jgi:hypothetical protein
VYFRGPGYSQILAAGQQRKSLGALFLLLAAIFAGGAFTAGAASGSGAGHWIVAVAAGAIAIWFVGLSVRAFRAP